MSGYDYTHPNYTIDLLDRLETLGLTNEAFRRLHHLSRKGTKKETINGMRNYCRTIQSLGLQNERVTRRLEFVLKRCQDRRLTLEAQAEAAWLAIPPD